MELYIKDGINGFVSEPNNIEMFRNKLDFIANHYDEAKLIGQKGIGLVHSSFNYKKQTNIILQSIKTIISKR